MIIDSNTMEQGYTRSHLLRRRWRFRTNQEDIVLRKDMAEKGAIWYNVLERAFALMISLHYEFMTQAGPNFAF